MAGDRKSHYEMLVAGLTEGLARIRLGPGVVGNTNTTAIVALLVCLGVIWALKDHPPLAIVAVVLCLVFGAVTIAGTWRFADKHPDLALLGGSDFLRLREMQMAGKGMPEIRMMPATEPPPLPVIDQQGGAPGAT